MKRLFRTSSQPANETVARLLDAFGALSIFVLFYGILHLPLMS